MKQTITALALAGVIGVASQPAAAVTTAHIDWDSFTWTLYDLDPLDLITPNITFYDENSSVHAGPWSSGSSTSSSDWVTPISAIFPPAQATADAHDLYAVTGPGGEANFSRGASFTLSPKTLVTFSADATVSASPDGYASASLSASGPGASGKGVQHGYSQMWYMDGSGTLTTSFLNMTEDYMEGHFSSDGYVYEDAAPVPEPETYALMLAGLGLVGWMARRRA